MKRLLTICAVAAIVLAVSSTSMAVTWHVPEDGNIPEVIGLASAGDKIIVGPGEWYGAVVNKAVEIKGEQGAVIVDGPAYKGTAKHIGFQLVTEGSGAIISHFTFRGGEIGDTGTYLAFPIFGAYTDDVTVEHNVMNDPIQGVTNWYGSGWVITHNVITGLWDWSGGGIGIFIGAFVGTPPASGNLVAFNKITGDFPEVRTYSCTGICLMTYGGDNSRNKVVHNHVLITGWEAYAIGMTFSKWYTAGIVPEDVLHDNKVGFNDLRGSGVEIACTIWDHATGAYLPDADARALMESCNRISRNLGENRARDGIPACEFKPVAE